MEPKEFLSMLSEEEQQDLIGKVGAENLNKLRVMDLTNVGEKETALKLAGASNMILKLALMFAAQIIQQCVGMPEYMRYAVIGKLIEDAEDLAKEMDEDDEW